jgi:DNA recombination protein RmuC
MEFVLSLIVAALLAALATWLVLRTKAATLQERLNAREIRAEELQTRLGDQLAQAGVAQGEATALRQELASAQTRLEEERKAAAEKQEMLRDAQARLSDAFKALSADALRSNNEAFLGLARATLEKFQDGARTDLEKRQLAIDKLMEPVKETLGKFDLKMSDLEKARLEAYVKLTQQVSGLALTQETLQRETSNLVKALGSPGVRGRWGEVQLRRVVEIAGMLQHCDFEQQVHQAGEGGALRPDMVVRLPGGKSVVVDAKTPLTAYLEAIAAPDEATRRARMADHARSVREHMISLGKKAYWEQFQPAPEFVVLFLPGENFYSAALEQEPALIEKLTPENRVVLATPTTLIALLHAFAYGWRQEALAENAQQISELGRELHERLVTMTDHFSKVGSSLASAVENYNKTLNSLDARVLVSARKFQDLKATHTDKELKSITPIEVMPRPAPAKETPLLPKLENGRELDN